MLDGSGRDSTVDDTTAVSSCLSLSAGSELLSSSTLITSVVRLTAEELRFVGRNAGTAEETCEKLENVEFCD